MAAVEEAGHRGAGPYGALEHRLPHRRGASRCPDRISSMLSLQHDIAGVFLVRLAWMPELGPDFMSPQMRMKKLEEIRLEVDSRRRTVQELTQKARFSAFASCDVPFNALFSESAFSAVAQVACSVR